MSKITSIRITNPLGSSTTADFGVLAENVDFGNNKSLEDKFVPFTGATSSAAGEGGLVPAPSSGDTNKFLKSDGTWDIMPAASANTLGGIKVGNNLSIDNNNVLSATDTDNSGQIADAFNSSSFKAVLKT